MLEKLHTFLCIVTTEEPAVTALREAFEQLCQQIENQHQKLVFLLERSRSANLQEELALEEIQWQRY